MPTISPFNIWVPDSSTALKPLATSFVTMATSISNALQATDAGAARPFASAAARDAYFPFPVQGNRAFRTDLGWEEAYYLPYHATTNPGGKSPSGWQPVNKTVVGEEFFVVNVAGTNAGSAVVPTRNYAAIAAPTYLYITLPATLYASPSAGSRYLRGSVSGAGTSISQPPSVGVHVNAGQEQQYVWQACVSIPANTPSTVTVSVDGSANQTWVRGTFRSERRLQ